MKYKVGQWVWYKPYDGPGDVVVGRIKQYHEDLVYYPYRIVYNSEGHSMVFSESDILRLATYDEIPDSGIDSGALGPADMFNKWYIPAG